MRFGALVLPNEPWHEMVDRWQRLEAAGLDSVWSCDHFTNPHRPGEPWFEGWSSLMGLAMATSRVRIGLLVGAITSRHPALLAKHAQAVDHASGGRLEVGLGAGGAEADQPMWGQPPWSDAERARRFEEYVELVDLMLRGGSVTFQGQWYATDGAVIEPGLVQKPRPPLVLAAHGKRTIKAVARYGDTWNTYGPTLEEGLQHSRALDAACAEIGRDPASIRRSVLLGIMPGTAWTTVTEFLRLVEQWSEAGFTEFVFYDPPYARAGVPVAPPDAGEVITAAIADLRDA